MQHVAIADERQSGSRPRRRPNGPCPADVGDRDGERLLISASVPVVGLHANAVAVFRFVVEHCVRLEFVAGNLEPSVVWVGRSIHQAVAVHITRIGIRGREGTH